jgi:hypothetical protein
VQGLVRLADTSELRPRSVTLHAFGDEITSLGLNVAMQEHTHPFDLSFSLWTPSIERDTLPAGEHRLPFEFVLPEVLPPTFNGELTQIGYRLEVKVDLPLHVDVRAEQSFVVLVPPLVDADKAIRATASLPDGLTLELNLKASGFQPGDHILGDLQIIGTGATAIQSATIDLMAREKGEAHAFVDHVESTRVRIEIDPSRLTTGQPFPIDLPIPEDVDPSFMGQHSAKSRLVRAELKLADDRSLAAEAAIRIGAR